MIVHFYKGFFMLRTVKNFIFLSLILLLSACGGTSEDDDTSTADSKLSIVEDNVLKYAPAKAPSSYSLTQLSNSDFNALSDENKYVVADKLLSSMFFSYKSDELKSRIDSGSFISEIQSQLLQSLNDMGEVENEIHNDDRYTISDSKPQNVILSRFWAMNELDEVYFNHWMSYILTQTILFSPAAELGTVSAPDAYGVYNRLYYDLEGEKSMRYSSFVHMASDENWRRFRSPEDNGREMLEIFALDGNDSNVPIAAQALKNWHLSKYTDTLVVTQDRNTEELSTLSDMRFKSGLEFYAALANSPEFTQGVTSRLVDFMFTDSTVEKKSEIVQTIVGSKPEAWADILKQILFSKEYLLHTQRVKSIEELAFPLMKKTSYNSYYRTFDTMTNYMDEMSQPSMKYKLGKLTRVPLDDISFAFYQTYLRNEIFRTRSLDATLSYNPRTADNETKNSAYVMSDYTNSRRRGISCEIFMSDENFQSVAEDYNATNANYVEYVFHAILNRAPTQDESQMLLAHISTSYYYKNLLYDRAEEDYNTYIHYETKYLINYLVFEYMIRLDELYFFKEVL